MNLQVSSQPTEIESKSPVQNIQISITMNRPLRMHRILSIVIAAGQKIW